MTVPYSYSISGLLALFTAIPPLFVTTTAKSHFFWLSYSFQMNAEPLFCIHRRMHFVIDKYITKIPLYIHIFCCTPLIDNDKNSKLWRLFDTHKKYIIILNACALQQHTSHWHWFNGVQVNSCERKWNFKNVSVGTFRDFDEIRKKQIAFACGKLKFPKSNRINKGKQKRKKMIHERQKPSLPNRK